jgi:transposase
MSITVTLTSEELAQIKQIVKSESDCEAVERAVREFLRLTGLRWLKGVSGKVDFDDNWRELESLEPDETAFPQERMC